ncbi:flavodoxin [Marinococcus luteus]|uniref:flavodoxin n=1 Tax=Marinococcus luteus TaxID=1122204 RepID=UPI002ACCC567|nr:flavodoxin [Marinococcus luteus]MDZ5783232.1 flavodoxin [Marinococcus luteus]
MKSILMIYASMSGNTEEIADILENELQKFDIQLTREQFDIEEPDPLHLKMYDGVLFGTYTWGDGDLPYEVEDYYEEMENVTLESLKVGLFGSCDSMYPKYGEALDIMRDQFQKQGAQIVAVPLKVELDPEAEDARAARELAHTLMQYLEVKVTRIS